MRENDGKQRNRAVQYRGKGTVYKLLGPGEEDERDRIMCQSDKGEMLPGRTRSRQTAVLQPQEQIEKAGRHRYARKDERDGCDCLYAHFDEHK